MTLHFVDYLIIILSLVVSIGIGIRFSKGQKSTSKYFAAEGKIPAWAIGLSILATLVSSITFLAYPGEGFTTNWIRLVQGLMVPVVRGADRLSLAQLSAAIKPMVEDAQKGSVNPDLLSGGTFTITNVGPLGGTAMLPTINYPEVAILGMGKVEKRVVVVDDMITIRPRMFVTLGYDHRLIDGATAEKFLSSIKNKLENFDESAL